MQTGPFFKNSIAVPILLAELGSSLVALGSVLTLPHFNSIVNPVQDFTTRNFTYPMKAQKPAPKGISDNDPLFRKAREEADELVNGAAMIAAGIAAHGPIQMLLEGRCDAKSFGLVIRNKTIGVGAALGGILLLNTAVPKALPAIQKAICPLVEPFLPKHCDCDHSFSPSETVCRLMIMEGLSSTISAAVNYSVSRGAMRRIGYAAATSL